MISITEDVIDPRVATELLEVGAGSGSVVCHYAQVKPVAGGRSSRGIRFTPTAETGAEMNALEESLRRNWKLDGVMLVRRMGELAVGDLISVVAVAAAGRGDAFGAVQEAVSGFKKMVSMQKEEMFDD
ncbi:MAG TPA: molybdenum cofactor biosynthesis protein MoaE [Myxococcota bacterium]|nr:molybdenum cofactor biosynthesis protein MoaE [Myxococcota bacterium]